MATNIGVLTTRGITELAKWLGETGVVLAQIGYGSGTTAAAASDEALEAEIGRGDATIVQAGYYMYMRYKITNSTGEDIFPSEMGIFNLNGMLIWRGVIIAACRRTVADGDTWQGTVYLMPGTGAY